MTPVHVLISEHVADEHRYAEAFGGAIELYRFRTNLEAFERLTGARSRIDVLVMVPNEDSLFNMSGSQLVERLLGPLGGSVHLQGMQIVAVGASVPQSPRVHQVGTLDAAIRLIKFGEVESTPQPAVPVQQFFAEPESSPLVSSLISSIWDAVPGQPVHAAPGTAAAQLHVPPSAIERVQTPRGPRGLRGNDQPKIMAGGPAAALFAHADHAPASHGHGAPYAVADQTHEAQVSDTGLQAVQPYTLPSRGEYRGNGARSNHAPHAIQSRTQAPLPGAPQAHAAQAFSPPQLAQQVQQLVYPATAVGADDPILGWSSPVQQQLASQGLAPAAAPAQQHPQQQPAAQAQHFAQPAAQPQHFAQPAAQPQHFAQPAAQPQHFAQPAAQPQHFAQPAAQAQQPVAHPHQVAQPQFVQQQPARGGIRGGLARMKERVVESERAPVVPRVAAQNAPGFSLAQAPQVQPQPQPQPMHAPQPVYAAQPQQSVYAAQPPQGYAPQQGMQPAVAAGGVFEATPQLVDRATAAGDVSFG